MSNPIEELRLIEEEIRKGQDPIVLTDREMKNIEAFLKGR